MESKKAWGRKGDRSKGCFTQSDISFALNNICAL
jgi:hypothetical protein